MKANVRVSPKLTKIIIQGLVGTNTTAYVAKTIDWLNKNTKDITLPTVITGGFESFVLSDDFIFMMNF